MKLCVPTQIVTAGSWMGVGKNTYALWAPVSSHSIDVDSTFFREEEGLEGENGVYHSKPSLMNGLPPAAVSAVADIPGSLVHYCLAEASMKDMGYNNSYIFLTGHTGIRLWCNRTYVSGRYLIEYLVEWLYCDHLEGSKCWIRQSRLIATPYKSGGSYGYSYNIRGAASHIGSIAFNYFSTDHSWSEDQLDAHYWQFVRELSTAALDVVGFNRELGALSSTYSVATIKSYTIPDYSSIGNGDRFMFNEPFRASIWRPSMSEYWYGLLVQESFLGAVEGFPRLNDNMLANVIDVAQFIADLVLRHRIQIPKRWSEGWLSYRYTYSTTKSDIRQAVHYIRRVSNIDTSAALTQYGISRRTINGVEVTCRCKVRAKHREVETVTCILDKLYEYGLSPTFYAFWDLIPYSFIVDWIVPVGDVVKVWDSEREYSTEHYDYDSIVYSLAYTYNRDGITSKQYSRWVGSCPPRLHGYYALETRNPSSKTIAYRVLDLISLTL